MSSSTQQCLLDHELLHLPKGEQQRKRELNAQLQLQDREWKSASATTAERSNNVPWRPKPKTNGVGGSAGELFANAGLAAVAALHRSQPAEPTEDTLRDTSRTNSTNDGGGGGGSVGESQSHLQSQAKENGVTELSAAQWQRRDALERLENALVAARQSDSAMAELAASLVSE